VTLLSAEPPAGPDERNAFVDAGDKAYESRNTQMTLTVKEKEHWKERISRKIDQALETLCAENEPGFRERIRMAARQRAVESLGIAQSQTRLDEIEATKKALDSERQTLMRNMAHHVMKTECHESMYSQESAINGAIRDRQRVHEKELLAAEPLGRRILELQRDQEELLDTVWLATSPMQVKQLWNRVAEVLNQKPTTLQQDALSLEPMSADNTNE
jgi:hypothetical protein